MKKSKTFDIWDFIYSIHEILTKPKSLEFKSSKNLYFQHEKEEKIMNPIQLDFNQESPSLAHNGLLRMNIQLLLLALSAPK